MVGKFPLFRDLHKGPGGSRVFFNDTLQKLFILHLLKYLVNGFR